MAGGVWIFAEHENGALRKATLELLGKGRELARGLGVELDALILGEGVKETAEYLARYVDRVYLWEAALFAQYRMGRYLEAIASQALKEVPLLILGGATPLAKDLFPRIAAKIRACICVDCLGLALAGNSLVAKRPMYGGKVIAELVPRKGVALIALVRPNTFALPEAPDVTQGEIVMMEPPSKNTYEELELIEVVMSPKRRLSLTEADVVITGGCGVKSAENFALLEELAELLGGAVGATRGAVDNGWRPSEDQVGKSGKTVSPKLYIAVGLSGAIHHIMGMDTSEVVVAINNDPHAPIFQHADYGIEGDLFEVIPQLISELKRVVSEE